MHSNGTGYNVKDAVEMPVHNKFNLPMQFFLNTVPNMGLQLVPPASPG